MAISINPMTYVIYVPRLDMPEAQASPEVRTLDVNSFRLQLKDLEDDPDYGIFLFKTHNHNTEVSLAGLTYARIVEILAPYTIEFEDGQYTVNCTGANHNISDRKVANQVSLIVNNAAGLISNALIEFASFNGGVTYDSVNGYAGTGVSASGHLIGTPAAPSNNTVDAKSIATTRGLSVGFLLSNLSFPADTDLAGFTMIGQGKDRTTVTIPTLATVTAGTYKELKLTGAPDGITRAEDCDLEDLSYFAGEAENCRLSEIGEIVLAGGVESNFINCYSGKPGTDTPTINCGGSGQGLGVRGQLGGLLLKNKTGTEAITVDMLSGQIKIESATVTNGTLVARGVGKLVDSITGEHIHSGTYGSLVILNEMTNPEEIAEQVMSGEVESNVTLQEALKVIVAALGGKVSGAGTTNIVFRDLGDTKDVIDATVDENGNRSAVTLDTT